jgi:ABC-type sugar transport system substrate-binding protein
VTTLLALLALLATTWGSQSAAGAGLVQIRHEAALTGVAQAKQVVKQLEAPVGWTNPGPSFKLGNQLNGKTVYFLANGLNFPFVQNLLAGLKEAAKVGHMGVIAVDGNGDVAKAASLIQQGVGRHADVIVDEGFPSQQLTTPIKAAKAAHIPLIEIGTGIPGLPPPSLRNIGVSAWTTFCYSCAGRQMADTAVAQSNGRVRGVIFNVPGISVAAEETSAIQHELRRLCPKTCKAKVVDSPLAEWTTILPTQTSTSIERDASVNFLFPLFDAMVGLMAPSVTRLNAGNRVKFVTYNATLPPMQLLKKGQLVSGDVGSPQHWLGWAIMDQAYRLLTHLPPVANEFIPNRLFDRSDIGSVDLAAGEASWYGRTAFRKNYQRLWGK